MQKSTSIRLAAALLAAVAAYILGHWFFFDLPFTTDENSYVFQAHNFIEGRIARSAPPVRWSFFQPMLICDEQVGWMSRYPPAHPLWLAPGILLGNARLMSALAAGLSVWLLTGCALLLNIPALLMCLLLLASPYFLFVHGSLLSHTSGILAVSLMLWAYLKWAHSARWGYAALAGLAWSLLLLNRTYTAALLALPFGLDALWHLLRRRTAPALAGTLAFALCATAGLGCFLGYNLLTTGNPLLTTYEYYCPGNFGPGVLLNDNPYAHKIATGWKHMLANLSLLDTWLFGFKGSLLAALALGAIGWLRRWSPLWLAGAALIYVGHIAFWYPGVNNIGPYYYFETFPFLALMTALGLTRLWRWAAARQGPWPAVFLAAADVLLVAAATFMVQESRRIQDALRSDREFVRHLYSAPANTLIVIDTNMPAYRQEMLVFNPRGLDSQPLIVRPYEDGVQYILRHFNDRKKYRMEGDGRRGLQEIHPTPLKMAFHAGQSHRLTGADEVQPDGSVLRVARSGRDAGQMLAFGQFAYLYAGRFTLEADLVWSNVAPEAPIWLEVASNSGRNLLARRAVSGSGTGSLRVDFSVLTPILVEPRIYYGGSGDVAVGALRLADVAEDARP